jgi:phospholipid/cholesterol/gamma-HCH transport system permease protein
MVAPGELRCAGAWVLHAIGALESRLEALAVPGAGEVVIDARDVEALDTSGAWMLQRTIRTLEQGGRRVRVTGLRPEFEALRQAIAARAVVAPAAPARSPLLAQLGRAVWHGLTDVAGLVAFVGEGAMVALRAALHPHRVRWKPILHNLQSAGVEALPITGLLSFLLGIVIAYQGAEQLQRFGANIYVADLVGLSMVRELSPMMTAIIVAGRSGSAYAAQIGTMKATEEIDALRTVGVVPFEVLVLPKVLALAIALPLLTAYTDVTGILGGMVMARFQLGVGFDTFLGRLQDAITLKSYLIGIGKAPVFAVIIAIVGCYQGLQVGGSAESIGRQTTVSVVQSIFLVIVADALFSIVFSMLDL